MDARDIVAITIYRHKYSDGAISHWSFEREDGVCGTGPSLMGILDMAYQDYECSNLDPNDETKPLIQKLFASPGTWEAKDYRVCAITSKDGHQCAEVVCDTATNAKGRTPKARANAQLISAARDLFRAAEVALERLEPPGCEYETYAGEQLRKAMSKATRVSVHSNTPPQ